MVSVPAQRFRKRILNLKSHHDLSSLRHLEAVNNYVKISYDMMNSLMLHLKSEKNTKKTKRVHKSKVSTTQVGVIVTL